MQNASQRIATRMGGTDQFNALVHRIISDENIKKLAHEAVFEEDWLSVAPRKRKIDDCDLDAQGQRGAPSNLIFIGQTREFSGGQHQQQ